MSGALEQLFSDLQASAFLAGISMAFGEEYLEAQDQLLPLVVVVPRGGPWGEPGYISGLDANIENLWSTQESIDVHMFAFSATMMTAKHSTEVEILRQRVLSAFQDQRAQVASDGTKSHGLVWRPVVGRWMTLPGEVKRIGACYVQTMVSEISVSMVAPVEVQVETIDISIGSS